MSTIDLADREGEALDLTAPDATAAIAARSPLQLFWRRLKSDKVAMAALVFIVLLMLVAIFAPRVVELAGPRPPDEQSTKYLDSFGTPKGPSSDNIFGADPLGRDV